MSASVRMCLAALVLSSGLCVSEAFSRYFIATPTCTRPPPPSLLTRLTAMPRRRSDSFNAHAVVPADSSSTGMKPPRRRPRGRPRRSTVASRVPLSPRTSSTATSASRSSSSNLERLTTTTTATATSRSSEASTSPSAQSRRTKILKSSASSSSSNTDRRSRTARTAKRRVYTSMEMVDHELLTKEQELALGEQVQSAMALRGAIATLLEAKQEEARQQRRRRQRRNERQRVTKRQNERDRDIIKFQQFESLEGPFFSRYDRDDYDGTSRDKNSEEWTSLPHMAVYGTATSQAMDDYRFRSLDAQDDELFYQDGSPFEGGEYYASSVYSIFFAKPTQEKELQPQQPSSQYPWLDALFQDTQQRQQQDLAGIHLLTDQDIVESLGIPGGRNELRSLVLDGALARDKLIRFNLKLVINIAKKWAVNAPNNPDNNGSVSKWQLVGGYSDKNEWRGQTLDEAIQEGVMGLAHAAERFDPSRGLRFATFATVWITRFIRVCFQRQASSGMRVPPRYHVIKSKFHAAVKMHYQNRSNENAPLRMESLANEFGVGVALLERIIQLTEPVMSIDAPIRGAPAPGGKAGSDTAQEYGDFTIGSRLACEEPQPQDLVEQSLLRQRLENAMATELSPHERDILRLRLGLEDGVARSLKEVSQVCGGNLSLTDIRCAERRAYKKLRSPFAVHSLWQYFADFDGADQ